MTTIQCRQCWKTIQKKGKRLLCVHCTNVRNREIAKKYRDEYKWKKIKFD